MNSVIEYQELKFKTSFKFKNKREKRKYFTNLLIENIYKFQEQQKKYFAEKLHVIFSYEIAFKFLSYFILFLALVSPVFKLVIVSIACSSFLISLYLHRKFKNNVFYYSVTTDMNELPEFINPYREELIKNKNKYKSVIEKK